ncbi:MAG: hypothetical protein ACN4GT_09315, partial [Gammaproteobacteria bacterium]
MKPDLKFLPEILQESVLNWFERRADDPALSKLAAQDPSMVEDLARVVACSPYVADNLDRYPDMLAALVDSGRLGRSMAERELVDEF